jgi:hypothetical protein
MKTILFLAALLLVVPWSWAGDWREYRPLETIDQSRQRHSAERYDRYQKRQPGTLAPFGNSERFGDPAPPGTFRPGFEPPYQQPHKSFGTMQEDRF